MQLKDMIKDAYLKSIEVESTFLIANTTAVIEKVEPDLETDDEDYYTEEDEDRYQVAIDELIKENILERKNFFGMDVYTLTKGKSSARMNPFDRIDKLGEEAEGYLEEIPLDLSADEMLSHPTYSSSYYAYERCVEEINAIRAEHGIGKGVYP